MKSLWFFDDVNLFKLLCPHKFKAYKANHDFDAYKKKDYIYFEEERYLEALDLFDQAESLYKDISEEDYYNFSIIAAWRGRLYAETGQNEEASLEYESAYAYAKKINDAKSGFAIASQDVSFRSAAYTELAKLYLRELNLKQAKKWIGLADKNGDKKAKKVWDDYELWKY